MPSNSHQQNVEIKVYKRRTICYRNKSEYRVGVGFLTHRLQGMVMVQWTVIVVASYQVLFSSMTDQTQNLGAGLV